MKVILSHDIDHLHWNEHYFKDLFLLGSIYRNSKGFLKKQIDLNLYLKRLQCVGRIHRIPELIDFYNERNINATFFFGMSNALGLSYNYKKTKELIQTLKDNNHKVGVHGISYNKKEEIKNEFQKFKEVSGLETSGIRTHYLRSNGYSLKLFDEQGYTFDSSIDCIMNPFKIDNLWEIPISIMDVSLVANAHVNQNIEEWKNNTLLRLDQAIAKKTPYFVINFHDLYFSDHFPIIREWYTWLVDRLMSKNYNFISFEEAVNELNKI